MTKFKPKYFNRSSRSENYHYNHTQQEIQNREKDKRGYGDICSHSRNFYYINCLCSLSTMIHLNYTYSLKIFASACLISVALLFYCLLLLYEMEHQLFDLHFFQVYMVQWSSQKVRSNKFLFLSTSGVYRERTR